MSNEQFDVIVIGGGSAGCVAAARLSDDPSRRVLLVEEGDDPQPVPDVIANPKRQGELILSSPYIRQYDVERPDGSWFALVSGKVLGGGSSVNNIAVMRPLRRDFDDWARFGGEAWSYDACLPIMIALEDDPTYADSPIHGTGGPLKLMRRWTLEGEADPPVRALVEAARELGIPECPDLNVPDAYGLCASPYTIIDGKRQSAVNAFIDPVRDRPNLVIRAQTVATRLIVDGSRVTGVELQGPDGTRSIVDAERVVVSAGAYQSPHLLLNSGIGPSDKLAPVGIPVRHELAGVGENFQDHAVVYLTYQGTESLKQEYLIPKVRLFVASDPSLDHGDLHILMHPSIAMEGMPPLLPVSVRLLEDRSPGRISLASDDPLELPVVDPGILRHPTDVAAVMGGIRIVEQVVSHPAMAKFYGPLVTPSSPDEYEEHIVSSHITYNHAIGTCRMGPAGDPLAVVDPELRVHGMDNLWVADCSVLPTLPHCQTNLAANMIGTIVARNIAAGG